MAKEIPTNNGPVAIVDDEDYERIAKFRWTATKKHALRCRRVNGKVINYLMHREILNPPADMEIDHINGNGFDNRKANLRLCTSRQNTYNRGKHKRNTTGYKGVSMIKKSGRFLASAGVTDPVTKKRTTVRFGYFDTAIEAAKAYDKGIRELHGEFAYVNFPVN